MSHHRFFSALSVFIFVLFCAVTAVMAKPTFTITIDRNMTCKDNSTIGRLLINQKEMGRTLELPWRNNETNISRIPQGEYNAWIRKKGNRKWRIQLDDVPYRKDVQIHIGKYQRNTEGCILVGKEVIANGNKCSIADTNSVMDLIFEEMKKFAASDDLNMTQEVNIRVVVKG